MLFHLLKILNFHRYNVLNAFSELNTCTLSWKEAIETTKSGFYSENYLKFAPVKASGKPVNFCVEFVEEKLVHAGGNFLTKFLFFVLFAEHEENKQTGVLMQ